MHPVNAVADIQGEILRALHSEHYRYALQLLDARQSEIPNQAAALALRAEALLGLAEFDEAQEAARQALQLDPSTARAMYVLGTVAQVADRQAVHAAQWYRQATLADPQFPGAHNALGLLLLEAGFQEQAAEALRTAQALEPENWRYAVSVALLEPPGRRAAALRQAYQRGLREHPNSIRLRVRLAGTYLATALAPLAGGSGRRAGPREAAQSYQAILAKPVWLTYMLLTINAAMFLLMELQGGSENDSVLQRFGAEDPFAIVHHHEWWRLLTPLVLHAGPTHLLVNGVSLYFVGTLYERCVGPSRFLYVYLVAGLGGSVASLAFTQSLAVGASGAIFGVFGGLAVYFFRNRALFGRIARSLVGQVLVLSAINLLLPNIVANVDGWAHAGGLGAGILAAWAAGPVLPLATASENVGSPLTETRDLRRVVVTMLVVLILTIVSAALIIVWNPAGA